MARLAIFIDGGYYNALADDHFRTRFEFPKVIEQIKTKVIEKTPDTVDILRTFYYDCLPYQSQSPTESERIRYGKKLGFFNYLETLPRVQVRQGRLAIRGKNSNGIPIFQQKRTDLLLGLDFAELSTKRQVSHIALFAGDSDFCPAVDFAKKEGVCVWLFHGPRFSKSMSKGECTFAEDLWKCCDERCEIDQKFVDLIKRS